MKKGLTTRCARERGGHATGVVNTELAPPQAVGEKRGGALGDAIKIIES